jgi:nanoRNase/pAp phosphatase (c-di-AMP/oligoRNAs hydrolase)
MDFKQLALELTETVKKYHHLLIYIKGSPDPDAIAASFVLKLICEHFGTRATINSPVYPSLPQNIKIIKDLHLPIHFEAPKNKNRYDAYAVLDHQSIGVDGVTGIIPCAIQVDHHELMDDNIPIDLKIVSEEAGSTCTIMTFIMKELGSELNFKKKTRIKIATALYYGIQTDTDDFLHAGPLDKKALKIISPDYNRQLIHGLSSLPYSREFMDFFNLAMQNQVTYKDWLISGIGYINEKYRDTVSIIGDFLLKREDISTAVVFSIVEKKRGLILNVSFRTKKEHFNLNALIKRITSEGGGRKFKGAYQVNLDYFVHCTDKDLLWKVVYTTTLDVLKKQRDARGRNYLKNYLRRAKGKLVDVFR